MNRTKLSHNYGLLLGIFFLGQFMVLPILTPLFLEIGASIKEIGIIMAVMGFTVVVLEMPTGGLADELGRKKLFLCSLILSVASLITLIIFTNVVGAIISMFFWGAAISVSSGTITAWFVETFNQSPGEMSLQEGFSRVGIRTNLMGACGAIICSIALYIGNLNSINTLIIYKGLLIAAIICYLLIFLLTFVWIQENRQFNKLSKNSFMGLSKRLKTGAIAISHPVLWRIMLAGLFSIPLASAIEKFWQVEFDSLSIVNTDTWIYGVVFAVTLFLGSLAAKLTTWLCQQLNQQMGKVLFIGLTCQLVSVTALTVSDNIIMFAISFIAFDFSLEIGVSARNHLISHATQDSVRSTVDSITSFISRVGGILGTLLCALGASYLGLTNTWLVGAAIASLAGIIYLNNTLNQKSNAELNYVGD